MMVCPMCGGTGRVLVRYPGGEEWMACLGVPGAGGGGGLGGRR